MNAPNFSQHLTRLVLAGCLLFPSLVQAHTVKVESEYGADKVTPRLGTITVANGTEQTFDAPEFVYLNRNFVELDEIGAARNVDDSKIAYYRARNIGYAINSTSTVQGSERFFKQSIFADTTVVWKWKLEYAVFFESVTAAGARIPLDLGYPERNWLPKDSQYTASMLRNLGGDAAGGTDGFRYSTKSYELQNVRPQPPVEAPNDPYYWKMREGDDDVQFATNLPEGKSITVCWWGKVDRRLDNERDQVFFQLLNNFDPSLAGGFSPPLPALGNERRKNRSTTFGVRPDGRFFVEEISANGGYRELASVPSQLVGLDWHHWSVAIDFRSFRSANFASPTATVIVPFALSEDTNMTVRANESSAILLPGIDYVVNQDANTITLKGTAAVTSETSIYFYLREVRVYRDNVQVFRTARGTFADNELAGSRGILEGGGFAYNTCRLGNAVVYLPTGSYLEEQFEGGINNLFIYDSAVDTFTRSNDALSLSFGNLFNLTLDFPPVYGIGANAGTPIRGTERLNFPREARAALRVNRGNLAFSEVGNTVSTETVTIDDWLRVRTIWTGEVRYRFDALRDQAVMTDQSFVRYYADANPNVIEQTTFANQLSTDVWVPLDRKVEVGAYYRSTDRCYTMAEFATNPTFDVAPFNTIGRLSDTLVNGRVARVATVARAVKASEIHFEFRPTVFRAEVPLGQAFDASNPSLQLVPALCDGAVLKAEATNPATQSALFGVPPEGISSGKSPLRWEQLGKRLYPVQPGSFEVTWPDRDKAGVSYRIEIVSGFPASTVALRSERENPNGTRQGTAPDYIKNVVLPGVDARFPSAPSAHYRHHFDAKPDRSPPTKLDISAADNWRFQELTFSAGTTGAKVVSAGESFTVNNPGLSVLLYTFRPNSGEVADGVITNEVAPPAEHYAVRVINSSPVNPGNSGDNNFALGNYSLRLGSGSTLAGNAGATGIVPDNGVAPATIDPGSNFVLDFWLDTSGVRSTDPPVTILTTGTVGLQVMLDAANATLTASYLDITTQHPLPRKTSGWNHYVIHVFQEKVFALGLGLSVSILDFYANGKVAESGQLTNLLPVCGSAAFNVTTALTATSLRFGVNANPASELKLDQLRLYSDVPVLPDTYLNDGDVRSLRENRVVSLRGTSAHLHFSFEATHPPSANQATGAFSFRNTGSAPNVGFGSFASNPSDHNTGVWVREGIQEVATRISSARDNAGFNGGGYIMNAVSNYNADLYQRNAELGTWGPIFPVNYWLLFEDPLRQLEVAYYENPYLQDALSHPNVAWPYQEARYKNVVFPEDGPHKDKRIYVASRIGSEGVNKNGYQQPVFHLNQYEDLKIYHQPSRMSAGFNPNEEHALTAPSNRAALKLKTTGEDIANNPPLAAFALQHGINDTTTNAATYTSHPWVLVQFKNLVTGEPEMAAYLVEATRPGTLDFPRPADAGLAAGLSYESAPVLEDRFLVMNPANAYNFKYDFNYRGFAGDALIPPYPLNLVIGNVTMLDATGNSMQVHGVNQRSLWRDVNHNAWIVSGDGRFFHQFYYPFRSDFFMTDSSLSPIGGAQLNPGTPIPWEPTNLTYFGSNTVARRVIYDTFWRTSYPKLKRGETMTYQGGEYFNENPGAKGLPAIVAMKAAEIIYDSGTKSMVLGDGQPGRFNVTETSARIIRPLDRLEQPFTVEKLATAKFTPDASDKIFIVGQRWYFKELPGSLQKRFYFDSLTQKLVFRGRLNEKESGDSNLTVGPDPLNILEPNVMTRDEFDRLRAIGFAPPPTPPATVAPVTEWQETIGKLWLSSQNPHQATAGNGQVFLSAKNLQGVKDRPADYPAELSKFWTSDLSGEVPLVVEPDPPPPPPLVHLDSFGIGAALVPSAKLLTSPTTQPIYLTIAENNRAELDGAPISLHIIEILPDRYRGAIKVIEAADAFSEKITLQHNAEFGANTGDIYYEWWIRDAAPLDLVATEINANGTLAEFDGGGNSLWQQYLPLERQLLTGAEELKHRGLHSIVFEGRPDIVLADKLVLMRYRHKTESSWTLVPLATPQSPSFWTPGSPAPFQWAGAANSPQIQADGSKRYLPQLAMGWIKRVLDRINPYEARYTDFFNNESPATYSSQIQIAGGPFAGKVALNSDKNVIEKTGLIELYETVLARARELSIDNSTAGAPTDGINQALLLGATRLSILYELLAREAYSDAQDPTINAGEDSGLTNAAPYTFAFQNMEADVLHEELALLRGTDFRKSYPVYNRLFWNYSKGLGEAAYNVNYNIYDTNTNGFINEDDARKLYPQGHGDAWGHYLSAIGMHYTLLQHPLFRWQARSELYSLMQNVLEVDFLDEKSFAKLAAGKARTGRDIVRATYRLHYTQDPDGQWQGYTDGADPARAWGVSEWAHRASQGAYFDWAVANAILPAQPAQIVPGTTPENLDRLERSGAIDEIGEVAAGIYEIQSALDEANGGVNPLGFDSDTVTFDMDPAAFDDGSSHFEQIYERALAANGNALATLEYATRSDNKLRALGNDTDSLIVEALQQDLDYRNRLIEIFGSPYAGTIGFGKPYPEGYEGPDTLLYAYLDRTKISEIVPQLDNENDTSTVNFQNTYKKQSLGFMGNQTLINLFTAVWGDDQGPKNLSAAFKTLVGDANYELEAEVGNLSLPYATASRYAFKSGADWGQRTSYGRTQRALEDMLTAEITLDQAIIDYIGFLQDWEAKLQRIDSELKLYAEREGRRDAIDRIRQGFNIGLLALRVLYESAATIEQTAAVAQKVSLEAVPKVNGPLAYDLTFGLRASIAVGTEAVKYIGEKTKVFVDAIASASELLRDELVLIEERKLTRVDALAEFEGQIEGMVNLSGADQPKRDSIGLTLQQLELARQDYFTAQAEGFRLLKEREAFNKILAAKTQRNRYQDMLVRLSRNETMAKYQSAFNHAARYTWLAAKAYDFETSLDANHPAGAGPLLDRIVKERQLGLWADGAPQAGQGGLAEILHHMNGNFQVLKGQLGINNPQLETEKISLRGELFRIGPSSAPASNERWKDALNARIEPDLNRLPEFVRHCRPFADPADGPQPGLVLRFSTSIEPGRNFFGQPLAAGDHSYSAANYATKVRGFGVSVSGYTDTDLSITPRAYLVPAGNDYLRISTASLPVTRVWNLLDQRIPTPFITNQTNLSSPAFIPSLDGVDGRFSQIRRHGDFRIYPGAAESGGGVDESGAVDESQLILDSRLIGRSVWNSEWLLIIPGANLHADPSTGLDRFTDKVSDIKIYFDTYSHQGQ